MLIDALFSLLKEHKIQIILIFVNMEADDGAGKATQEECESSKAENDERNSSSHMQDKGVQTERFENMFMSNEQILNINGISSNNTKLTENGLCSNLDEILEVLGGFGKFQLMILTLLLGFEIPAAFLVFVPVLIGSTPPSWMCGNETTLRKNICHCEGSLSAFDPTVSIVAEWNLVCNKSWVSDSIVSLQMLGMMFGCILVSQLSDWYGRRHVFVTMVTLMLTGSVVTAIAPNPFVYAASRFFCGGAFAGFLSNSVIYSLEFLTPKWRQLSSVGPFGEGTMLLGIIAYYLRPWRVLVWVTLLPFAMIFIIFPFVPESPRWLLRNRKYKECLQVLNYIAKVNGMTPIDMDTLQHIVEAEQPPNSNSDEKIQRFSYLEFVRDKGLRKTTLYLQGIWFMWAIVYFGISYNIRNLQGNPFLNIFFIGLVDAIGFPTSFVLNNRIGRRKALVSFMTITAICLVFIATLLLTVGLEGQNRLFTAMYFISKFGTAGARSAMRTLTGESFPTALRTMGVGLAGVTASLGAALAPQLAYLGTFWPSLPLLVLAAVSILGSLLSFLVTETSGQPLQEVHDAKVERPPARNYRVSTVRPLSRIGEQEDPTIMQGVKN